MHSLGYVPWSAGTMIWRDHIHDIISVSSPGDTWCDHALITSSAVIFGAMVSMSGLIGALPRNVSGRSKAGCVMPGRETTKSPLMDGTSASLVSSDSSTRRSPVRGPVASFDFLAGKSPVACTALLRQKGWLEMAAFSP